MSLWIVCSFIVLPIAYPTVVYFMGHQSVQLTANFLVVKGLLTVVCGNMFTLLFSRYMTNDRQNQDQGVGRFELKKLSHNLIMQGFVLMFAIALIIMKSILPYLWDRVILGNLGECSHESTVGWIDTLNNHIDPEESVCYMHFREFKMGIMEIVLFQNFGLANVAFHAITNNGFLRPPVPMELMRLVDGRVTGRSTMLAKVGPQLAHWLVLLTWFLQAFCIAGASIDPNWFDFFWFNLLAMISFCIMLVFIFCVWWVVFFGWFWKRRNPYESYWAARADMNIEVPFSSQSFEEHHEDRRRLNIHVHLTLD